MTPARRRRLVRLVAALALLMLLAGCLGAAHKPAGGSDGAAAPTLRFRPALDLGTKARPGAFGTSCQDSVVDGDCGLGEPQVEVDSKGTVYVSGVCCLTVPPPVYVSRDGGATFTDLATATGVREALGIEGDFAIDGKGRVYFSDIEFAASFQVTAWDADGTFLHHTKWPAPPLVDRDWIRAEGDGHLYYVYNTGTSTNVYTSTDTGRTWSPAPVHTVPWGLGMAVKGPALGELWVIGGGDPLSADATRDGGATWQVQVTTIPAGNGMPVAAFNAAGAMFGAGGDDNVSVARRDPDGTWNPPVRVSPPGHHRMPWVATGAAAGTAALCWYGTPDTAIGAESKWYVYAAASLADGAPGTWNVSVADPQPVFVGNLGRDLLDFFQCELGPDDAMHVAYSQQHTDESGGPAEQLHYVRSEPVPALASGKEFPWGPGK